MKWYVTNGVEVKSFEKHIDAMRFVAENPEWYEVMS